jgi:hypothetical protein
MSIPRGWACHLKVKSTVTWNSLYAISRIKVSAFLSIQIAHTVRYHSVQWQLDVLLKYATCKSYRFISADLFDNGIYLTAAATFLRASSETGSLSYQTSHPINHKMRDKEWIS